MNLFIVSDIHGMYPQFKQMLEHWDKESQLVILGDMIDRGKFSYEVVQEIMQLQVTYPEKVVVLKGNHEDMLMYVLDGKMKDPTPFLENGGKEFLQSFIANSDELTTEQCIELLKTNFEQEMDFLRNAKRFYQIGNLLITHAGFESAKDNWQDTAPENFLWIREHYKKANTTGLINIFGHTPTRNLHEVDAIWHSSCGTYINIDGGCAYGGQLNGLHIREDGEILEEYIVK